MIKMGEIFVPFVISLVISVMGIIIILVQIVIQLNIEKEVGILVFAIFDITKFRINLYVKVAIIHACFAVVLILTSANNASRTINENLIHISLLAIAKTLTLMMV
jgi:hypothetical protein